MEGHERLFEYYRWVPGSIVQFIPVIGAEKAVKRPGEAAI
jgi:hypothetical protein